MVAGIPYILKHFAAGAKDRRVWLTSLAARQGKKSGLASHLSCYDSSVLYCHKRFFFVQLCFILDDLKYFHRGFSRPFFGSERGEQWTVSRGDGEVEEDLAPGLVPTWRPGYCLSQRPRKQRFHRDRWLSTTGGRRLRDSRARQDARQLIPNTLHLSRFSSIF